jgi:hypothetical protein
MVKNGEAHFHGQIIQWVGHLHGNLLDSDDRLSAPSSIPCCITTVLALPHTSVAHQFRNEESQQTHKMSPAAQLLAHATFQDFLRPKEDGMKNLSIRSLELFASGISSTAGVDEKILEIGGIL